MQAYILLEHIYAIRMNMLWSFSVANALCTVAKQRLNWYIRCLRWSLRARMQRTSELISRQRLDCGGSFRISRHSANPVWFYLTGIWTIIICNGFPLQPIVHTPTALPPFLYHRFERRLWSTIQLLIFFHKMECISQFSTKSARRQFGFEWLFAVLNRIYVYYMYDVWAYSYVIFVLTRFIYRCKRAHGIYSILRLFFVRIHEPSLSAKCTFTRALCSCGTNGCFCVYYTQMNIYIHECK